MVPATRAIPSHHRPLFFSTTALDRACSARCGRMLRARGSRQAVRRHGPHWSLLFALRRWGVRFHLAPRRGPDHSCRLACRRRRRFGCVRRSCATRERAGSAIDAGLVHLCALLQDGRQGPAWPAIHGRHWPQSQRRGRFLPHQLVGFGSPCRLAPSPIASGTSGVFTPGVAIGASMTPRLHCYRLRVGPLAPAAGDAPEAPLRCGHSPGGSTAFFACRSARAISLLKLGSGSTLVLGPVGARARTGGTGAGTNSSAA